MEQITISDNTIIKAIQEDQIFREMDGEAVILNIQTGAYCGLNTVGTRIWQIIQEPVSVVEIRDTLLEEYNVDQERCERELLALLNKTQGYLLCTRCKGLYLAADSVWQERP